MEKEDFKKWLKDNALLADKSAKSYSDHLANKRINFYSVQSDTDDKAINDFLKKVIDDGGFPVWYKAGKKGTTHKNGKFTMYGPVGFIIPAIKLYLVAIEKASSSNLFKSNGHPIDYNSIIYKNNDTKKYIDILSGLTSLFTRLFKKFKDNKELPYLTEYKKGLDSGTIPQNFSKHNKDTNLNIDIVIALRAQYDYLSEQFQNKETSNNKPATDDVDKNPTCSGVPETGKPHTINHKHYLGDEEKEILKTYIEKFANDTHEFGKW
jgi:hypothetical protein